MVCFQAVQVELEYISYGPHGRTAHSQYVILPLQYSAISEAVIWHKWVKSRTCFQIQNSWKKLKHDWQACLCFSRRTMPQALLLGNASHVFSSFIWTVKSFQTWQGFVGGSFHNLYTCITLFVDLWYPDLFNGYSRVEKIGTVLPISTHLLSHLDDPLQVVNMYVWSSPDAPQWPDL